MHKIMLEEVEQLQRYFTKVLEFPEEEDGGIEEAMGGLGDRSESWSKDFNGADR